MKLELIRNVVKELSAPLSGAKMSKIHQPSPEILLFKLWTGRESLRLLVSTEAQKSRIHLTEQTWPNPHIPPRFCQLLRARITKIDSIAVVNEDRIIQLQCLGAHGTCHLYIELIGNRGNLILVDDQGVIIDVLKRISGETQKRTLLAGEKYIYPERTTFISLESTKKTSCPDDNCTWNQTVEKLYRSAQHSENKEDFTRQLQLTIDRQIKKLRKRMLSIEKESQKQKNYDDNRQIGELLLANLHTVPRGLDEIVLLNYYLQPPEPTKILLDPLLSPQQNAEKYFSRYKKGKRGQSHSQRRLEETQEELEWMQQLDYQLNDTVKNSDKEEIAVELRQAGLLKDKSRLHNKRTLQASKPHEATSPSGLRVIWGRNNRQNDEISTKFLKNGDFWFHAHGAPGAHVVLKSGHMQSNPTDEDLYYAASLAAGYSKVRSDAKVEVMLADAKSVHKAKGSRAGLVNVLKYKTLIVKPFRQD